MGGLKQYIAESQEISLEDSPDDMASPHYKHIKHHLDIGMHHENMSHQHYMKFRKSQQNNQVDHNHSYNSEQHRTLASSHFDMAQQYRNLKTKSPA